MHPFFKFFTTDRPYIPRDHTLWPQAWKKVEYKSYPRFPQIDLPEPQLKELSLKEAISKRRSQRNFSDEPITKEQLSALLFFGAGISNKKSQPNFWRRAYPSGGGRYPIELYCFAANVNGLQPGFYHYNVQRHSLEFLLPGNQNMASEAKLFHYEFAKKAAVVFIFSMVPERSTIKYGNFALKVGLIETGHLAENVYLAATALDLKCCALGGFNTTQMHQFLDLDGLSEIAFYAVALGA